MRKTFLLIYFLLFFLSLPQKSVAIFYKNLSNPLLNINSAVSWDKILVNASNTQLDGSTHKMWYTGFDGIKGQIGLTTSNDGIFWVKYENNPVLSPTLNDPWEKEVGEPSVLKIDSKYRMWFTSFRFPGSENYRIRYAESSDGINWTKTTDFVLQKSLSWENEGVSNPTVLHNNGIFKMWYAGIDNSGKWRIGFATSSDGLVWNKNLNPVLQSSLSWEGTTTAQPSVLIIDGIYHMYYHAGPVVPYYIGHAISSDGINWTKDPSPVLERGGFGAFDRNMIASPDVLRVANKLKMYYSGHDGANWRIGMAEETLPVPYFSQADPAWGSNEYDHAANWASSKSRTISAVGCALTSAAMVLKHFNIQKTPGNTETGLEAKDLTPGTLNEWMKSRNDSAFRNGATNWALISTMTRLSHENDAQNPKLEYFATNSTSLDTVLNNNLPAILDVDYPPSPSNSHFVVATKKQNTTYAINDPFYSDRTTLAPSYSTINRVGYYQPTNSDFSYVIFAVDADVSLTLKNSAGQQVGESFIQQPLADPVNGTSSGGEILRILMYKAPPGDTYTLTVSGTISKEYQLDGYLYDQTGGGGLETNTGVVGQKDSDTFIINLDKTSAESSTISENVTTKTTTSDAQSAYNLGWISNKAFYGKLLKDLKMIDTLTTMKKTNPAKLLLTATQKTLDTVNGKFLTNDGYELLTKDITVLMSSL